MKFFFSCEFREAMRRGGVGGVSQYERSDEDFLVHVHLLRLYSYACV